MSEQGRNLLIGVFVIAAICISVWIILFLHPVVGDQDRILRVRFTNVEQINLGSRVTYAGRPMGQVVKIARIKDPERADEEGNLFVWELELAIDSGLKITTADEVTMRTTGLFGERDIAILPHKPKKDEKPELITDQVIYAEGADPMQSAFSQIANLACKIGEAIDKISEVVSDNSQLFKDTLKQIKRAAGGFATLMEEAEEQKVMESFRKAADNLGSLMSSLKNDIDKIDKQGFFDNLAQTSSNIEQITGDIAQGRGTIGRLITCDDLYLRTMSLMGKGETLLNDINHYGLLFHTNRRWKRERERRMNDLQVLQCPQAFRAYFDCEIDAIQTSLARINCMLERPECPVCDPCFLQEFSHLLREVRELQGQLQRYNEQLMQCGCNY